MDQVLNYVRAYHEYEGMHLPDEVRGSAVRALLGESPLGRIWLIGAGEGPVGYVAACFGYSIEFGGRDAFVDELYIVPEHRGRGHGRSALRLVKPEAARLGVRALHLEVARTNDRAQRLYRSLGFAAREKYFLMSAVLDEAGVPAGDGS